MNNFQKWNSYSAMFHKGKEVHPYKKIESDPNTWLPFVQEED